MWHTILKSWDELTDEQLLELHMRWRRANVPRKDILALQKYMEERGITW